MVVFPRSVLWISSVYWSATKVACVGGGRDYISVTEVTSEVSTEVVIVTERLRVSGRGRKWRRSSVFTSLVELAVKSCAELLHSCGINILDVFSDIPVFWLDNKLPTTFKHRTRNMQMYGDLYVAQKGYLSALHFWAYTLQVINILLFLSEINILALARSSEINILIYFDLKSRFLTYALHEMRILLVFKWNSTALLSGLNVKSTF